MRESLTPLFAESVAELWAALHKASAFRLAACERHCLIALALTADDEIAAHLLLKKVKLARVVTAMALPGKVARLNSRVEYRHGGGPAQVARLRHPQAIAAPDAVSVASLLGAGLIGLEAGQSVLWPAATGASPGSKFWRSIMERAMPDRDRTPSREERTPAKVIPFPRRPAPPPKPDEPPPSAA